MFVHCVYFWLKPDLSAADRAACLEGVRSLRTISTVKQCVLGMPADTDRPVIDRSYSYALIVTFDDQAGHDAYQADPIHDRFRETCGGFWDKVLIYDVDDRGG